MESTSIPRRPAVVLTVLAVAAAIAVGVQARMADPDSSRVLPAEDTYTHLALVREHLRDGELDSLNPEGTMYPPGLHAVIAAGYAYAGTDLYTLVQFGPVLLGALGILGMALLLYRTEGSVAAFLGAAAYALAPETVFRTTMMAPTALDLALLPFFLLALVEVVQGRLAWAWPASAMALFFVFAHPWLLSVIALAGFAFVVLARILPWPRTRGATPSPVGITLAMAIVGVALGLSLSGCWGACGSGFRDIVHDGARFNAYAPLIAGVSLVPLAIVLLAPRRFSWLVGKAPEERSPASPWIVSALLGAAVLAMTIVAVRNGMPPHVNLVFMFGKPILVLGAIGLLAVPHRSGPGAHVGAALAVTTFPFVIFNPLDSPFWSHRTAAYMGVGLVVLAAMGAVTLAAAASRAYAARAGLHSSHRAGLAPAVLATPLVLVSLAVAGSIYAGTHSPYPWYRLYTPCEHDALREVAGNATAQPKATVITGDWQSKLVIAALTDNASRVWFTREFFNSPGDRRGMMALARPNAPLLVVVEKHLANGTDTDFLDQPPWTVVNRWCTGPGEGQNVTLYRTTGGTTR